MRITVDISSFAQQLDMTSERLRAGILRGVRDAALNIEREAKANLQGDARGAHLMSSIHTEVAADAAGATAKVGVGGATGIDGEAGENFGIYVHEGTGIYSRTGMGRQDVPWFYKDAEGVGHQTSGMVSNPFLENAYNSEAGSVNEIIGRALFGG